MKKLLLVIVGILFAFNANATTIPEGAVVKTANNPDVYIVKYKNGKQFKRLVLNPQVFESYGHLRWENILTITQTEMNSFTESTLVRSYGENNVYKLVANGDSGDKALVDSNYTYDPDSVYTINKTDSGNYFLKKLSDLAGKFNDIKLKVASPKIDFCNNIEGAQTSLPAGMYRDNGNCYTKVVISESTQSQEKLNLAANNKSQIFINLNELLNDYNSLNLQNTEEINRMNNNLNALIGYYDESSNLFRKLTTLRRDRLINAQNLLKPLINNNKLLKKGLESYEINKFASLNLDSFFIDESNFLNQVNASFVKDKNSYDDSARTYISILELLGAY